MGLLDDAIREHLELKRKHGASDEEISQAEHEALTPARRDPAAGAGLPPIEEVDGEAPLADEPPPMAPAATDKPPPPDLGAPPAEPAPVAGDELLEDEPAVDQPTAIRQVPPPVDDPVYAEEYSETPAPADPDFDEDDDDSAPPAPARPAAYDDEDDYLAPAEPAEPAEPAAHPALESTDPIEAPELEHLAGEAEAPATAPDPEFDEEYEPDEVPSDEALGTGGDPYRSRTTILDDPVPEPPPTGEEPPADGEQDVLEETPDFLQETPEHDKLWFEQKPPRDFDFD